MVGMDNCFASPEPFVFDFDFEIDLGVCDCIGCTVESTSDSVIMVFAILQLICWWNFGKYRDISQLPIDIKFLIDKTFSNLSPETPLLMTINPNQSFIRSPSDTLIQRQPGVAPIQVQGRLYGTYPEPASS